MNPAGQPFTASFSVKGVEGQQCSVQLSNGIDDGPSQSFTLSGGWQRISTSAHTFNGTASTVVRLSIHIPAGGSPLQVTEASLENATSETVYCPTAATAYGAVCPASLPLSGSTLHH